MGLAAVLRFRILSRRADFLDGFSMEGELDAPLPAAAGLLAGAVANEHMFVAELDAYAVAAAAIVIALWYRGVDLRQSLATRWMRSTLGVSLAGGLLAAVGYNVRGDTQGLGLVIRLILGALGAVTVMAFWLARHHARGERIRVKV